MIVDDQPGTVKALADAARDLGEVLFAADGFAALAITQATVPDIVLLDIEMPGMDGYDVCKAFRANPAMQDAAIFFVTSHEREIHEIKALNLGGVDYLQKPINVPVALARIRTQLELRLKAKQLAVERRNLEEMVHNLPAFVGRWSLAQTNIWSNDVSGRWFGVPSSTMVGMHIRDILGESVYQANAVHFENAVDGVSGSFDIAFAHADGTPLYGQVVLVTRKQLATEPGFLLLVTDVTERKHALLHVLNEKERLRITLKSIGDAVIATDSHGFISFLNPIAETMTGWSQEEAIGQSIEAVMPLRDGQDGHALENPLRLALREARTVGMTTNTVLMRRDGSLYAVEDSAAPILDDHGNVTGSIIVFHDVSEASALAVKMTHLANHDPLTGLPNRMLLRDRSEQALQQARREEEHVILMILDIDHFKNINDSDGHSVGDKLLLELSQRLTSTLRACDTVSRQGGDEFIVLLPGVNDLEQISGLAQRLLHMAAQPFWVDSARYDLSVSIGISVYPNDAQDIDTLYRHADSAMYQSKEQGRNRYRYFSADIEDGLKKRQTLVRQLREAIEQEALEVHYQLKYDAESSMLVGAEALVRWRLGNGQLVPPSEFITVAEQNGLIVGLGELVLRRACKDARAWHLNGHRLRVAVNVSAVQIDDPMFVPMVHAVLQETSIDPKLLELEITEGVLAKNIAETLITLNSLKSLGISIAIDDFGTGYSSLAYLRQFPIDVLKIDQSFVREIEANQSSLAIINAIVTMGRGLGLRLVAEGVETVPQAKALLGLGCHVMQGYLFSKPVPLSGFIDLMKKPLPNPIMGPTR